jgi:two-component system, LuxR family, sensor kinase FixL
VAIQRDITQRKLAEARMTMLAHAVESTSELICITDLQDRFTFVNRAFQQTYGYAEYEILGKTPEILFSPKNPPKLVEQITEQTRSGGWRGEVLDQRKDGTEFPISLSTSRIMDESGVVIGLMGVARDITERTRDQEALRESEQRFRTAFGAAPVAMAMVGADGRVLQVNRALCEMLGYTEKELLVKTVGDITYPSDLETTNGYIDRLLKGQRASSLIEKRYIHKLGPVVWGRTTASLIRDKSGHPLYFIAHIQDVTERRRLEGEILEISDREQRRIGQDLHDGLCQQLVSTAFASNRLSQQLATKAPSEAGTARQIAGWLDEAISQSRALARGLYPVKLEADGLASALQELAEYVNERFGITCTLENMEAVSLVDNAVATHLYRIAQEAVINAVKHSKAGRILIKLTSKDGNISVRVEDDGVGIPDGIANGMGLHIMQYRTRMIGGSLKIEHGTNGGTVVVCSFQQEKSTVERSDEI